MRLKGIKKKTPRGTLRFWGVKFNGIVIVFVGGQTFNWFIGQKAQPEPLLHSLSQLKLSTLHTPSGQKNHFEQLSLTEGHYFWQMTDIWLFQRVNERLPHIIISSEHTVPNEPLLSFPIKGIYFSSWVKLSFSPFSCIWAISPLWCCFIWLRSVLLSGRVKVTSVWLSGRHPSAPGPYDMHRLTERLTDRQTGRVLLDRQTYRETEEQKGRVLRLPLDEEGRRQISAVERVDCDLTGQTVGEWGRWATTDVTAC